MGDYVTRLVDRRLHHLLERFAAVSIVGPRACGKARADIVSLRLPRRHGVVHVRG